MESCSKWRSYINMWSFWKQTSSANWCPLWLESWQHAQLFFGWNVMFLVSIWDTAFCHNMWDIIRETHRLPSYAHRSSSLQGSLVCLRTECLWYPTLPCDEVLTWDRFLIQASMFILWHVFRQDRLQHCYDAPDRDLRYHGAFGHLCIISCQSCRGLTCSSS